MISEHAIIDPSAKLGKNVSVGPFTVIGPNVEIGEGTKIESHVVIKGPTVIGKDNHIFQFSSIGEVPQDLSFHGENSRLEIGDRNTIREYVTIHRGTEKEEAKCTKVGSDNLIMAYCHIAHDCVLGNHIILANMSTLAGHVHIDDYAMLGGGTLVHQFVHIGSYAFTGGGSGLVLDVLPHCMLKGNPATPRGLNVVGLRRSSFSKEQVSAIKQAYRIVFKEGLRLEEAKVQLQQLAAEHDIIQSWLDLLERSSRGIARPE